jgi:dimethylamine/trimethylamine dehydrogenase
LPAFITPEQIWAGKAVGQDVVVLDADGYMLAISLAEKLADEGRNVTIVTPFDRVAPYTDFTLEGPNLRRMMREKGIGQRVAHWVENATPGQRVELTIFDLYRDGFRRTAEPRRGELPRRRGTDNEALSCDSVVLCTRRSSNDGLYRELRARDAEWVEAGIKGIYRAGDCLAPRYIADAVFDGHRMGREIDSAHPERPIAPFREGAVWASTQAG